MLDDYLFETHVRNCKSVDEETRYLEIFQYTDPVFNRVEERPLLFDKLDDFLYERGDFASPDKPPDVILTSGVRLICQPNATHPETVAPYVISLQADDYISMVKAFNLPFRAIESTSCLGPLFWSSFNPNDGNPLLQIIYRKSGKWKKGLTRGWEISLCHELQTGLTTGFCKGTPGSDILESLKHLQVCAAETSHPMLLPMIIFSHDTSFKTDIKNRDAREWLRRIEKAVRARTKTKEETSYVKNGVLDLDTINIDLVQCHAQVLWKPPVAYLQILEAFKETMEKFRDMLPRARWETSEMQKIHFNMLSRSDFYEKKLLGTENYAKTTLQRLEIQRDVMNGLVAERANKLNFEMAKDQRKIALASKQDSSSMKTISILGIVFLPGTFLASILSTTFFDFYGAPTLAASVSPRFWLFWAVDIPMTLTIMGIWLLWERKRAKSYRAEEEKIGQNVDKSMRNTREM